MDESIEFLNLDGETPPAPAPEAPAPAVEPAPAEPNPAPETPPAHSVAPGHIPIQAMLDERERRQAAEKRLKEYEQREQPAKPQPSITTDPQGWEAARRAEMENFRASVRIETSGEQAVDKFGEDIVKAAQVWGHSQLEADPQFSMKFVNATKPVMWLVEQHRKAQALDRLGSKSPEDYAAEWALANGYVKQPEGQTQEQQPAALAPAPALPAAPRAPAPPRSIASSSPAGGAQSQPAIRDEDLLGSIF